MILNLPLIHFQHREFEMAILLKDAFMKYIANLSATYGHHMLPLLLLNLFPSQSHVNPQPLSPKKPNDICIEMDTQTDTHLLHGVHFDRRGCNWVCTIDPQDSWTVTFPLPYPSYPASWTVLSPFSVQDSHNISSNDRHHHKLSSLNNNKTEIIYLSINVSRMFILQIPITRSCHCLLKS